MDIYANLLNRLFDKTTVQSMMSSIHKCYEVQSHQRPITVFKIDVRSDNYIEVMQSCIVFEVSDAIKFLRLKTKEKNRFTESRKKWLEILVFAKKNYKALKEMQKNPTQEINNFLNIEPIGAKVA